MNLFCVQFGCCLAKYLRHMALNIWESQKESLYVRYILLFRAQCAFKTRVIQYSVLWLSYFANEGLLDRVRVPIEPKSGHSILDFFVFTYLSLQIIYFKIDALFVKTDCHLIYLFPHRKFRNISLNHRFMKRKNLQMILILI